jgi:UDP-N-acetylglucosamine--N-acetylmuramyl-(pentapeptide) pyrophosphoryl-undecaprenol N-acetylglucosamine transferase
MADQTFRVVLTGGGSGGHTYPLLAVAEALRERASKMQFRLDLTYLGPNDAAAAGLFKNIGVTVQSVSAGKIRRYLSLQNIADIPKFFIGFFQALVKLYVIMPDIIFSKGGTGALPVVVAGWFYRIPVVIHDSDAKPGLTNIASSFFAKRIFISFDAAAKYFNPDITSRTGVPVRRALFANPTTKELAKETLGFDPAKPMLLVLGGSQGAERINNFILANLSAIMKETQVLHQAGLANFAEVKRLSDAALLEAPFVNRYEAMAYLDDKTMSLALMAADVAVSRSGNSTLSELGAFGVPAILIPHNDGSNGHQRMNAYDFTKNGAGVVIEEPNLLPGIFLSELKKIISDAELRRKMSDASKQFFIPNAADAIVDGILDAAAG